MGHIGISVDGDFSRKKIWLGVAILAAAAFVVWQLTDTGKRGPANQTLAQAISEHCAQFVAIAKSSFGPDWKPRLDPRDPLCAHEIQRAWERQHVPRHAVPAAPLTIAPDETAPSSATAPNQPLLIPFRSERARAQGRTASAKAETSSASRNTTYCLNILGLARSKFGDDWQAGLTQQEAAACGSHAQKMR